jgi:hypothetical protein
VHSYETRSQQCVRVALAEEFKIKQNKKTNTQNQTKEKKRNKFM